MMLGWRSEGAGRRTLPAGAKTRYVAERNRLNRSNDWSLTLETSGGSRVLLLSGISSLRDIEQFVEVRIERADARRGAR